MGDVLLSLPRAPFLDSPLHLKFIFGHMEGLTDGQTAVEVEMVIYVHICIILLLKYYPPFTSCTRCLHIEMRSLKLDEILHMNN